MTIKVLQRHLKWSEMTMNMRMSHTMRQLSVPRDVIKCFDQDKIRIGECCGFIEPDMNVKAIVVNQVL